MPTPEDVLNNKNEGNENINQNQESNEIVESGEEMQKRLTQEITNKNEELKQEDIKIENANNSIGLSGEEVQEEKIALNLDSEISNINADAEKLTSESIAGLDSSAPSEKGNSENISFLAEKGKDEKFEILEAEFLKYDNEKPVQSHNLIELSKSFIGNELKDVETEKIIRTLPKSVINDLLNSEDPKVDSWSFKNAFANYQNNLGKRINEISNNRIQYFDLNNRKETVILGTMPQHPKEYLTMVANGARFVPKNASEKFVNDAVDAYIDQNKVKNLGGYQFINQEMLSNESAKHTLDTLKNLCDSGYKDQARKLLIASLKQPSNNPRNAFFLAKEGLFSKEEVKEILDQAGLLSEAKQEAKNESWG